jgi:endonuclease/exonuclease/phosphatase family metal-dependent hydrolase
VLILNFIGVLALILSCFSVYVNPNLSIYFAILGLLYPVWLFTNFIFILYWVLLRKWHFTISMFAIILGILPLSRFVQVTFWQPKIEDSKSFKVMSFNVRVFDLYNWTSNIETKNKLVTFLGAEQPDVICFQEYYRGELVHFSVKDTLQSLLKMNYVQEHITVVKNEKKGPGKNYFGSAVFSRFPIVYHEEHSFENEKNNHFSFVDIKKGEDTIRVFNAHIGSMRLQNADYKLIGGDDNKKWSYEKQAQEDLFARLTLAYQKRASQTITLLSFVSASPYPVILCTDLNDTPNSYSYNNLASNLEDAFVKSGNGIGSTYIGDNFFNRILPVNRIDYILHDDAFQSANFTTHQEKLSDHNAISCELQLK